MRWKSLCIVQDDSRDLEVHCESMSQIYSNSFFTISATSAKDGTEGLFLPRKSVEMRPCVIKSQVHSGGGMVFHQSYPRFQSSLEYSAFRDYGGTKISTEEYRKNSKKDKESEEDSEGDEPNVFTVLPTFREWIHSMKGPLLSRGWTLQERELSVRVLHFTVDRVVWECREQYASEDDPAQKAKRMLFDDGLKFRLLDGNTRDRKDRPFDYKFSKWMDLVEEYSARKLSIKDDKLRAIAGLAEAIKSIQQDDVYISGLWKRDLLRQLLWHAIQSPQLRKQTKLWPPIPIYSNIPTWSWAAYEGSVVFDRHHNESPIFSGTIVTKATSSLISLSGLAFKILFHKGSFKSFEMRMNQKYYIWHQESSGSMIYITFDTDLRSPRELNMLCLKVAEFDAPITKSFGDVRKILGKLPAYTESPSDSTAQVSLCISVVISSFQDRPCR